MYYVVYFRFHFIPAYICVYVKRWVKYLLYKGVQGALYSLVNRREKGKVYAYSDDLKISKENGDRNCF